MEPLSAAKMFCCDEESISLAEILAPLHDCNQPATAENYDIKNIFF